MTPARRERNADEVAEAFLQGDRRALARALSWIDDHDPRGREVLGRVFSRTGRTRLIARFAPEQAFDLVTASYLLNELEASAVAG